MCYIFNLNQFIPCKPLIVCTINVGPVTTLLSINAAGLPLDPV